MDRQEVESSMLVSIGYDHYREVLEVEFKHGAVYEYYDVPNDVYHTMITRNERGESVGSWFAARVKQSYRYSRVR